MNFQNGFLIFIGQGLVGLDCIDQNKSSDLPTLILRASYGPDISFRNQNRKLIIYIIKRNSFLSVRLGPGYIYGPILKPRVSMDSPWPRDDYKNIKF